jgi:hypothetical protein
MKERATVRLWKDGEGANVEPGGDTHKLFLSLGWSEAPAEVAEEAVERTPRGRRGKATEVAE